MDPPFAQARAFFTAGVAQYEAGDYAAAERSFAAALALAPGRPSVLTNLGAARLKLGRPAEALADLTQALAQEPDNAEALGHCGTAHAELHDLPRALACFDRAVALQPAAAAAWMLRGNVLRELGRSAEAAASYRESIRHGGDATLNGYYLAGLTDAPPPPTPPRQYVESLFDGYAPEFSAHVTQALRYDAPRVLGERLAQAGRVFTHALDLGCGTGLCGPFLRRSASRVTGVDLSSNMLAQARSGGCYDELVHDDAASFLAATPARFDAAVAADVFIYVGALDAVFAGLARVLAAGAPFGFTVEESPDAPLALRASLRYAHSEASLHTLAAAHGFSVDSVERRPVRHDQAQPIAGLFVWLRKS